MKVNKLLRAEEVQLRHLQELVQQSLTEEKLLATKLAEVEEEQNLSPGEKLADRIASFGGSWLFILLFVAMMAIWVLFNNSEEPPFDPYPFILLNLILSCVAALQAPIIMMSQNRQEQKDRRRARNDYMVNLKSEMEVRNLHAKIDLLMTEQMQTLFEIQKQQLELLEKIQRRS